MTNDPLEQRLHELNWRRKLTPPEASQLQGWLEAHPEAQADWEFETRLTEALEQLPPVPVANNFTARVVQAVERETAAAQRRTRPRGRIWQWRLPWLPKLAAAVVVLGLGLFSYKRAENSQRDQIRDSVVIVSEVVAAAGPEVIEDFDAIQASQNPPPDVELLSLFQ